MKKTIGLCMLLFGFSHGTLSAMDHENIYKDLKIMETILHTALLQKNDYNAIGLQSINSIYLANQGVLFEVSTRTNRSYFGATLLNLGRHNFSPPMPPIPPVETRSLGLNAGDMEVKINDGETEKYIEKIEAIAEKFGEDAENLRSITKEKSDIDKSIREKHRDLRDLKIQIRHTKYKRKLELEAKADEIRKKISELELASKKIAEEKTRYEEIQRKRAAEHQSLFTKNVNRFFSHFENVVSDTLCRYGSGLKSLPPEENITFRIKDLGVIEGEVEKRKHDKVYVFSKKSIKKCVEDEINSKEFIREGDIYIY